MDFTEFQEFVSKFGVMLLEALGSVIAVVAALITARINKRLKKIESGLDINGDGHADLSPDLADYCLKCAKCGHLNKLSDSTFLKEENKE